MIESIIRKLPAFKGKQRIARFIFKDKINKGRDLMVQGRNGCCYKIPNIKEGIGFEIFINGIYEKETAALIISSIPANGTFLDIGANIGAVSVPVCKQRNDISTFCVEASKRMTRYLQENISVNKINNCTVFNRAIAAEDGLSVNFFSPEELYGKGSMMPVFTQTAETVSTITLDTLVAENKIDKVSLIKIDVEGYEYHAFKGGEKLLSGENAPDILFEFADWTEELAKAVKPGDAQKLLMEYGYKLFSLNSKNQLLLITAPVKKGSMMMWATKK
jgi:FkbM family methyltransferase